MEVTDFKYVGVIHLSYITKMKLIIEVEIFYLLPKSQTPQFITHVLFVVVFARQEYFSTHTVKT
jgi:hypothetical protein